MIKLISKLRLYFIVAAAIFGFLAAVYYYYTDTQAKLAEYAGAQAVLTETLTSQQALIDSLKSDIQSMNEIISTLNADFAESRQQVRDLESKFNQNSGGGERDFGDIAAQRATLVEKLVNTATQEVLRCFELLSGSEATPEEIANEKFANCIVNRPASSSLR